ncbi:MAG TPA: sugar phosphate isomerase/epimerase family protein [Armatimonadota bacterium]|nr:sugar phosphate isomerase/epimerase family protein [Armatimonadota bacterium]
MYEEHVRIGTLVKVNAQTLRYLQEIIPYGFEAFSLTFTHSLAGIDLPVFAAQVRETIADSPAVISCISTYANPLETDAEAEEARETWERLIDAADLFGCDVVGGFTGRLIDVPVDQQMDRFVEVFDPLARRAADRGVRIAFENCPKGGNWFTGGWNIAHSPLAWEMIFNSLPMENIGLQWEPCHQMLKLIDPIPQLRKWAKKIFNVHGKDATILWDVIREYGIDSPKPFAYHRTPGFGDCNWTDVISILRQSGYCGSIDIEGWHDPVYVGELEMMGQVRSLQYLQACRGGSFVPNPALRRDTVTMR